MASRMYEAILDNIQQYNYNIFTQDNKTSLTRKIYVFFTTLREDIPKWHRRIWISISMLFATSTIAYALDISIPLRNHPLVTTIIFITATLPIIFQNKQRRGKIIFIISMLIVEAIGQNTGLPFGEYIYHSPRKEIGVF